MSPSLESVFRNPIIADRARLTERVKTHFTTPSEPKGLEFDVTIVPAVLQDSVHHHNKVSGKFSEIGLAARHVAGLSAIASARHGERSEAIHGSAAPASGLLRFARNDGGFYVGWRAGPRRPAGRRPAPACRRELGAGPCRALSRRARCRWRCRACEPISSETSSAQSTEPIHQWPAPASSVSGTAWAMSEPTMRTVGSLG